jgi:hypothetical protein
VGDVGQDAKCPRLQRRSAFKSADARDSSYPRALDHVLCRPQP